MGLVVGISLFSSPRDLINARMKGYKDRVFRYAAATTTAQVGRENPVMPLLLLRLLFVSAVGNLIN